MHTAANFERERSELQAVLASGILGRAPSLEQLLTYICARYFEGEANQLKEYNIAVEAFGRPAEFDQKRDSIVRVEAHRLRKRLREYYERDGACHPLRIVIPSGQYAPQFVAQEREPVALAANAAVLEVPPAGFPPDSKQLSKQLQTIESPKDVFTVREPPRTARWLWPACALGGAALLALSFAPPWKTPRRATAPAGISGAQPAPAESADVRVLAGATAPYVDKFGNRWAADRYFTGGSVFSVPEHPIFGTRDAKIYRTRREGAFGYDIPLKPGVYELRLHFAETLYGDTNIAGGGESSRIFAIEANGRPMLDTLDVIGETGASTADIRAFKDIQPASDGRLHLRFLPITGMPFLNAIELTPGARGRMLPIRIVARDHSYTDRDGIVWASDRYSKGGQLIERPDPVKAASDPEIYRGERFGNITYSIPVPPGRYALTLRFAETWFGPDKPGHGGAGSRIFDVLCNGVALARNVDIFREAGGADRALVKTFRNLAPNPQGKLVISFLPIQNYACINALEVLDENQL